MVLKLGHKTCPSEEGTGLHSWIGHLFIWPRTLADVGSTQEPGLNLESRAPVVVDKIWSMERKKKGIPIHSLAWMPRDRWLEVRAEVVPCTAGTTLLTVAP